MDAVLWRTYQLMDVVLLKKFYLVIKVVADLEITVSGDDKIQKDAKFALLVALANEKPSRNHIAQNEDDELPVAGGKAVIGYKFFNFCLVEGEKVLQIS